MGKSNQCLLGARTEEILHEEGKTEEDKDQEARPISIDQWWLASTQNSIEEEVSVSH